MIGSKLLAPTLSQIKVNELIHLKKAYPSGKTLNIRFTLDKHR